MRSLQSVPEALQLRLTVSLVYAEQSRKYSNEQWLEHFFILKQFGSSAKQTPWYNFLRLAVESALARNRRRDVVALCMRRKCFKSLRKLENSELKRECLSHWFTARASCRMLLQRSRFGWHGERIRWFGLFRLHPGMFQNVLEMGALRWLERQALADQIFHFSRQLASEGEVRLEDLLVLLERNVSAHHVVQQDAQRPHSESGGVVSMVTDPFGWAVHSSTYNIQRGNNIK